MQKPHQLSPRWRDPGAGEPSPSDAISAFQHPRPVPPPPAGMQAMLFHTQPS